MLRSNDSNRAAEAGRSYVSGVLQSAPPEPSGARRSATSRRAKRNPVPRGARRYLRPVAVSRSHPSSSTSNGSWPADWHASSRNSTSASRQRPPISAAGFTNPLCVGTWLTATSRTAGSSRRRVRSDTSIWPCSSSSTTSTRIPKRSRATRRFTTLVTYSDRHVSTTSPARHGMDQNAVSHASVALVVSATSSAREPINRPMDSWTRTRSSALSVAASYPPSRASAVRWEMTASSTGVGFGEAPAWLRNTRSSTPGVSARTRSRSIWTGSDGAFTATRVLGRRSAPPQPSRSRPASSQPRRPRASRPHRGSGRCRRSRSTTATSGTPPGPCG